VNWAKERCPQKEAKTIEVVVANEAVAEILEQIK